MRKSYLFIILLIVSLTFLLNGCIQMDVNTGIDSNYTAYLSYHILLDINETDPHKNEIINALHQIGWHYQEELDFIVQVQLEVAPYELIMTRRVENSSFEQAFQSLEDMLTNEDITPFMQVDMANESFSRQKTYLFGAMTDIPQIMRLSNAQELSPDMRQKLEDAIDTGNGSITVEFPASELIRSTHQVDIQDNRVVMSVPLGFTEQTNFELAARINFLSGGEVGGTFDEIVQEIAGLRFIAVIVCCAALFILLISILLIAGRSRRKKR